MGLETPANELAKLGKYGIVGVMLALVAALIFSIYLNFSLSTNYINENMKVNINLTAAITELSTIIKLPNKISMTN